MRKNLKKLIFSDALGVTLLVILTVVAGYMGLHQRIFDGASNSKISSVDMKNDYSSIRTYEPAVAQIDSSKYQSMQTGTKEDMTRYEEERYKTSYERKTGKTYYDDTNAPSIIYKSRVNVQQYQDFDPWYGVSATHSYFDNYYVTSIMEIIHNDVDVNIPGTYSIIFKACNYIGSNYCRYATTIVYVTPVDSYDYYYVDYNKGPVWGHVGSETCTAGSRKCDADYLTIPTARDPYSNRTLDVIISYSDIDIYTPGTYRVVYSALTENNMSGTISKTVTITKNNSSSYYDDRYRDDYYYDDYYYDDYYRNQDYDRYLEKFISEYKWNNIVYYTYRCDEQNQYGKQGWSLVSIDTHDNHPTLNYNMGGYKGTLEKTDFYCAATGRKDCDDYVNKQLGTCQEVGSTKQITIDWVGVYSGTVKSYSK